MTWGNSWDKIIKPIQEQTKSSVNPWDKILQHDSGITPELLGVSNWPLEGTPPAALAGIDLGTGEKTVLTTFEKGEFKHRIISQKELKSCEGSPWLVSDVEAKQFKSQGSNLVDDQQYLYFQCEGCNEILDPHTKSFAKLQEHRVKADWKCVWNLSGQGYKVYCAKCGEKV